MILKVRNQIDTIGILETKLKYGVNDMNQISSLPKNFYRKFLKFFTTFYIFHKNNIKTFLNNLLRNALKAPILRTLKLV